MESETLGLPAALNLLGEKRDAVVVGLIRAV
jgi:hypothetical protein